MTLASLLKWHYFSVQDNTSTEVSVRGSLKRDEGWTTRDENLRGNFQSISRGGFKDDVMDNYSIQEFERNYVIYHSYETFPVGEDIDLNMRVLMHKNPKTQLSFDGSGNVTTTASDVRIFDVKSNIEPVALRDRGLTLFEMHIEENPRMSL